MAQFPIRAAFIAAAAILCTAAQAGPTFTTLYSFQNIPDAANPMGRLIADGRGNLYGTTEFGGAANLGALFELSSGGTETVLHASAYGNDGVHPAGGLLRDAKGDLFGAASGSGPHALGALFELTASGTYKVLYGFPKSAHVDSPNGDLLEDSAGALYGTSGGGTKAVGVIFKFVKPNVFTTLYTFTGESGDGAYPSGLTGDPQGTMYGATAEGGDTDCNCGVVYSVTASGTPTILHRFIGTEHHDGANPADAPLLMPDGSLVGVSQSGGTDGLGTIYRILPDGSESILHNFAGAPTDGNLPMGRLVADATGDLYGVTALGGTDDDGTVFKFSSTGHFSILHSFTDGADSGNPDAGLLLRGTNTYVGTTSGGANGNGTVFRIVP
jgi:uncharacterized repeat protein (TIGR03803 family)